MKIATLNISFFGIYRRCFQFFHGSLFSGFLLAVSLLFFESDILKREVGAGVFRVGLIEREVFARKDGVEQDAGK